MQNYIKKINAKKETKIKVVLKKLANIYTKSK